MPHLVQMDKKLRKKGLTIIAPECQGSSEEAIAGLVKEHKIEYTITKNMSGPSLSRGIPHMVVFDVSGKLVFSGHPMSDDAEKAIKTALKEVEMDDSDSSSGLAARPKDLVASRGWTNSEGKQMQAALVKVEGTTGHFKMSNGKTFQYDIGKLSAADQEAIASAIKPAE